MAMTAPPLHILFYKVTLPPFHQRWVCALDLCWLVKMELVTHTHPEAGSWATWFCLSCCLLTFGTWSHQV
jgi:hypothetical protein